MSTVTLHCGDCLEFMGFLLDRPIDAIMSDPPYFVNINTDHSRYPGGKTYKSLVGGATPFDFTPWIDYPAKEQFWFGGTIT